MYLDKNEFELAKDYCRVGFDLDRSENYKFHFHTNEKFKPCIHICQKTIAALTVIFKLMTDKIQKKYWYACFDLDKKNKFLP